jgi:hypothetical protein
MSLKSILLDASSILGLDLTNPKELAFYIQNVNQAAEELYNSCDLPGSIKEQVFQNPDVDASMIALPYYVGHIRGLRYSYFYGVKIALKDLRPRYHSKSWDSCNLLTYRLKNTKSPLARDIVSEGPLTFTLSKAEASDVTIDLVCSTKNSKSISETLTIPTGTLTVTSTLVPTEVLGIVKTSGVTSYDITVKDINNLVLAEIPNSEVSPCYTILQIQDPRFLTTGNSSLSTIEVLYKTRFRPFVNMSDEFVCPNCDKLLFWKFSEHYASYKPGWEDRAILAAKKVSQIKAELFANDEMGKEQDIQFGENPFNAIQERIENRYAFRY